MHQKIIDQPETNIKKTALNEKRQRNQYQSQGKIENKSRQVLYNNRVLHVNKKYTVPKEETQFISKTNVSINRVPKQGEFRRYIDLVLKNEAVCRRGPCDAPTKSLIPNKIRVKRMKTQIEPETTKTNQKQFIKSRRVDTEAAASSMTYSRSLKKYSYASIKKQEQKKKKELPTLGVSVSQYKWQPIQVQKFISKSSTRVEQLSSSERKKQAKNLMLRRLDVQSINNNLVRVKTQN